MRRKSQQPHLRAHRGLRLQPGEDAEAVSRVAAPENDVGEGELQPYAASISGSEGSTAAKQISSSDNDDAYSEESFHGEDGDEEENIAVPASPSSSTNGGGYSDDDDFH